MTEFKQYRRSQIAELRPYVPGEDMTGISCAQVDLAAGSPKAGDMIARNPKNHADQWLVAAQYFADNFEPGNTTMTPSEGVEEELRALLAKATPGPWSASAYDQHELAVWVYATAWPGASPRVAKVQFGLDVGQAFRDGELANAALIVAAINHLPALLSVLSAQRERLGRMEEALKTYFALYGQGGTKWPDPMNVARFHAMCRTALADQGREGT